MAGPSSSCKEYTKSPLSKEDVNNIVHKINEGRNFVAKGLSRLLPQAANMNKIYWSDELAAFAQRWVDQCDSSTRPDKEDECRDLDDSPVGQNIVSVIGPAPGMHLTSLIDVWFMQKINYAGSVSYYNQSSDWKTNHFTQLIWADTDKMGCGRARFYVDQRNSIVERLVCNFSPKGNNHGKPVYAIGYPATQCQKDKAPDTHFHGLCANWIQYSERPFTTTSRPVSSLLRILNLSNNSVKSDIDPIRNNLNQTDFNVNGTLGQRNQKTRHVFFNNSHAGLRNMAPPPIHNQWNTPPNAYSPISRGQRLQHYQTERGHSRVYHGHDLHDSNFASNYNNRPTENFRKYDYTTEQTSTSSATDFRKYNREQCTRRPWTEETECQISHQPNQCTRQHGITSCPYLKPTVSSYPIMDAKLGFQKPMCQCNTPRVTCATVPPRCQCNVNCQCFNSDPNVQCLSGRRMQDTDNNPAKKDETRKSAELHYYDLLPNMEIRSGDSEERKLKSVEISTSSPKDSTNPDLVYNKRFPHKIRPDHRQVKGIFESENEYQPEHDYMFDSSNSRHRKRRSPDDEVTFKPFWQIDEYNRDKSTMLKALRYTTLLNRKKKTRQSVRASQTTESITFQLRDMHEIKSNRKNIMTEKYLSFDELMHLRKLSTLEDTDIDARRKGTQTKATTHTTKHQTTKTHAKTNAPTHTTKAQATKAHATTTHAKTNAPTTKAHATTAHATKAHATTTKAHATTAHATKAHAKTHQISATTRITTTGTTSEYTANTPFHRVKHCTRKITCTWTAPTQIGADGSVIIPGIGQGSRTPPGYVEGCTRTSTCTREFFDRNKVATIISDDGEPATTLVDEDYCEKRALNIRRRDSDLNTETNSVALTYTAVTYTMHTVDSYVSAESGLISSTVPTTSAESSDCLCYEEYPRIKRHNDIYHDSSSRTLRSKRSEDNLSYGDLYYLILQKIIKTWKRGQNSLHHDTTCSCNSTIVLQSSISIILFIFLYTSINIFI